MQPSHESHSSIRADTQSWSPSHEKLQLINERVQFFIENNDHHSRSKVLLDIMHNLFRGSGRNLDLGLESARADSGTGAANVEEGGIAVKSGWGAHTGKITMMYSSNDHC
jgi:hypothetical protein